MHGGKSVTVLPFLLALPVPVAEAAQPSPAAFSVACSVRIGFVAQTFERNLTLKRRPRVTCTNKSWVAQKCTAKESVSNAWELVGMACCFSAGGSKHCKQMTSEEIHWCISGPLHECPPFKNNKAE